MLRSVKVRDYMTTNLVTFTPETDVFEAVKILLEYKISGTPVVDDTGAMVGMFSEGDCLRSTLNATYYEDQGGQVKDFMTTKIDSINPEDSIIEIAEYLINKNRRRVPVVEEDRLVGQISRSDILRAIHDFTASKE